MGIIKKWRKLKSMQRANELDCDNVLERLRQASAKVDPTSKEFRLLRLQYEQELKNKKLIKECKVLGMSTDRLIGVAAIFIVAGFGFALDLDSPKALRLAQFATGLFKKI